jgi:hypothetical protein
VIPEFLMMKRWVYKTQAVTKRFGFGIAYAHSFLRHLRNRICEFTQRTPA